MKKMMLILIILASLLPGILAVTQYFDNEKKEKEATKNEIELKTKIDSLNKNNSLLADQISSLSKDNVKLSNQLTETSLLLNSNVKGGKEVDIVAFKTSIDQLTISAKNNSHYPIYDIQVVILDYDAIMKCNNIVNAESVYIDRKCYMANMQIVPTFNMSPKNETQLPNKLPIKGELVNCAFQIKTRNGIILRQTIFKITPKKIEQSYRIYELVDEKLIFKEEKNPLKISEEYWNAHFYSQPYIYMQGME